MTVTINGTTGVAVPLGSVSAPGVSNTTSSTTGIYNPTSTTLGIATNGVNAVYVDASQNVGIGTSSPSPGLDVSIGFVWVGPKTTSLGAGGNVRLRDDSGTLRYTVGILGSSGARNYDIYDNVAAASRLTIDTSGNLQVGGTNVGNTAGYVNSRTNARAWVNFNGTLTGTIAPRANYNISSITKNGTGDYTLNFTTALADANYAWSGSAELSAANTFIVGDPNGTAPTTTALRFKVSQGNFTNVDATYVTVMVFGN